MARDDIQMVDDLYIIDAALTDFRDAYRRKIGMPRIERNARYYGFDVTIGYREFRGLYMAESTVFVPFFGQGQKDLLAEARDLYRLLDSGSDIPWRNRPRSSKRHAGPSQRQDDGEVR